MVGHDAPRALEPTHRELIDYLKDVLASNTPLGIDGLRPTLEEIVHRLQRIDWLARQVEEQRRIIGQMVSTIRTLSLELKAMTGDE